MYKSVEINSYGLLLYRLYVGSSSLNKGDSARFFCGNMDPEKWDTTMWYRVTRNPQDFHRLTGCQRDPKIWGVTMGYDLYKLVGKTERWNIYEE